MVVSRCQLQNVAGASAAGEERGDGGRSGGKSLTKPIVCRMMTTSLKSYSPPSTLNPKLLIALARISERRRDERKKKGGKDEARACQQ